MLVLFQEEYDLSLFLLLLFRNRNSHKECLIVCMCAVEKRRAGACWWHTKFHTFEFIVNTELYDLVSLSKEAEACFICYSSCSSSSVFFRV